VYIPNTSKIVVVVVVVVIVVVVVVVHAMKLYEEVKLKLHPFVT
jgi:hypothetical protein